jgi:hypothetical protein
MAVLTSLGVKIGIGSSTTETTKPTTFTRIPQVIEMSEVDLDPDTIDTTSFDNTRYKSSVAGLIDTSGVQSLTVNATEDEKAETLWNSMAEATNAYVWLCVAIPGKTKATFIPIVPIKTGAYNVAVNDRITLRLRYTIREDLEFDTYDIDEMSEPA